jgi:hypothetical protein
VNLRETYTADPRLVLSAANPTGTDKGTQHCYIEKFYNAALAPYQNQAIKVVEIGIDFGASLALWSQFFTQATILGIDAVDTMSPHWRGFPRVEILIEDAYTQDTANRVGEFDIFIDDGPHSFESMESCLDLYLPLLREGG